MFRKAKLIYPILIIILGLIFAIWFFNPQKPVPLKPTITMEVVKEGAKYPDKVKYDRTTGNYKYYYEDWEGKEKYWVFEPGTKIKASIKADIEIDPLTGYYKYSYEVINNKSSLQKIPSFALKYGFPLNNVTSPDKGWYSRSLPEWVWKESIWMWSDAKYKRVGIKPGESQSGFSFESKGLPGIVDSYLKGYVPLPPPFPKGGAPGDKPPDFFRNSIAGKTVGPVAVPEKFVPEKFLNNLISLKDESFKLGWIDTRMLSFRLGNRLKAIGEAISKKDISIAKKLTRSFIEEIESLKDEYLTPEAYYILKFNAQYLLDHLT